MHYPVSGDANQPDDISLQNLSPSFLTSAERLVLNYDDNEDAGESCGSVAATVTPSTAVSVSGKSQRQLWPQQPERLGRVTVFTILSTGAEVVLVLTPVIFIGKFSSA
jgi:hypothetical protein